jgi:hypothetical protein
MAADGGVAGAVHLQGDEAGYERWLAEHPAGFVFNHFSGSDASFNVIHRSGCRHLWRENDAGRRTIYEKVCSESLESLEAEASRLRGGPDGWRACGACVQVRRHAAPAAPAAPRRTAAAKVRTPGAPRPAVHVFRLWQPEQELASVEIEPLLASWEARDHPAQRRLRAYLDELREWLSPYLADPSPRYVRIDVACPSSQNLSHHYDLENYLTPVAHLGGHPKPAIRGHLKSGHRG